MDNTISLSLTRRWRECVRPTEHGSWSLVLEPLALGLLVAPSIAGGLLAIAVLAGFFARRPLRIAVRDAHDARRANARGPLLACAIVATVAMAGVVRLSGLTWIGWLVPSGVAGVAFLAFDLRQAGREEIAEVLGALAFAMLPGALAILAGESGPTAAVLTLVMCGRAVPAVLRVRAVLRAAKTGVRRPLYALASAFVAVSLAVALACASWAPWTVPVLLGVFAAGAIFLLVYPHPGLRPRILGLIEAAAGFIYVAAVAVAWRA